MTSKRQEASTGVRAAVIRGLQRDELTDKAIINQDGQQTRTDPIFDYKEGLL